MYVSKYDLLQIAERSMENQSASFFLAGPRWERWKLGLFVWIFLFLLFQQNSSYSQALSFPTSKAGISFGNSKEFSGLRMNLRDRQVEHIRGINITLWKAKENEQARVTGLSLGLLPEAGYLSGIQIGVLGAAADQDLRGVSMGLLGVGSGNNVCGLAVGGLGVGSGSDMKGIFLGGLGAGSGRNMKGIIVGGLGAGAGEDLTGIVFGGLGAGAGENMKGIVVGGLGAGAGENLTGIVVGGLGAGTGKNMKGIAIGGLGAGAGEDMTGFAMGGLGAGCGGEFKGIAVAGIGAGAPAVKGILLSTLFSGGKEITGVTISGLSVRVKDDGYFKGFSASAFNFIKGNQTGVAIGLVNYSWHLNGIQLGIVNYVKDNPKYAKILPLMNVHFD